MLLPLVGGNLRASVTPAEGMRKIERKGSELKESRYRTQDSDSIHQDHEEKGACDMGVEEPAIDDSSLGRHVESSELWIDHREHGGEKDIRRKHGLVDLVPEGVTVPALDAGVRDV